MECIFCGTEIEEDFCIECNETCIDMGLDYEEMLEEIIS